MKSKAVHPAPSAVKKMQIRLSLEILALINLETLHPCIRRINFSMMDPEITSLQELDLTSQGIHFRLSKQFSVDNRFNLNNKRTL